MDISAIIVNYRTPDHVAELLPALSIHPNVKEVFVVDNEPLERFSTDLPGIKIKTSRENLGFGAAINLAVKELSTDWVLLVNPDVRLGHDCISTLIDAAELTGSPLLGPRFYWDHEHQFRLPPATGGSAWFASAMNYASKNHLERTLLTQYWAAHHDRFWGMSQPFIETYLSGACMLVDRSRLAFVSGDLLDPDFFLYFEDTDLCARAITEGYQPVCVPGAKAIHFWNQSPEPDTSKAEHFGESAKTYFHKHFGGCKAARIQGEQLPLECNYLGEFSVPPVLDAAYFTKPQYLEIALNELFVPFAQADTTTKPFHISQTVWQHMGKGIYFMRTRSGEMGVDQVWRFEKV